MCLEKSAQVVTEDGFHWCMSTSTCKAQVSFNGLLRMLTTEAVLPGLCLITDENQLLVT